MWWKSDMAAKRILHRIITNEGNSFNSLIYSTFRPRGTPTDRSDRDSWIAGLCVGPVVPRFASRPTQDRTNASLSVILHGRSFLRHNNNALHEYELTYRICDVRGKLSLKTIHHELCWWLSMLMLTFSMFPEISKLNTAPRSVKIELKIWLGSVRDYCVSSETHYEPICPQHVFLPLP